MQVVRNNRLLGEETELINAVRSVYPDSFSSIDPFNFRKDHPLSSFTILL